jgi:hypothetical protein
MQRIRKLRLPGLTLLVFFWLFASGFGQTRPASSENLLRTLPDLSALAWLDGERFLALHDSKNPLMPERPRISLIQLPQSFGSQFWKVLSLDWPAPQGLSSDLESIARIPGTASFLFVESGEKYKNNPQFRRIFHVDFQDEQLKLRSFIELPATVTNIEGAAVARLGQRLIFIFAERADSQKATALTWAELQLAPLRLGKFQTVQYRPRAFFGPGWRPVSAIEIDQQGQLYIASAFDPNDDRGPFRSVIWRIGHITDRKSRIILSRRPQLIARLDGLKIESLALRQQNGKTELFAGSDDEFYGGALRLIPLPK